MQNYDVLSNLDSKLSHISAHERQIYFLNIQTYFLITLAVHLLLSMA